MSQPFVDLSRWRTAREREHHALLRERAEREFYQRHTRLEHAALLGFMTGILFMLALALAVHLVTR